MMRGKHKSTVFKDFILFDGYQIPIKIFIEERSGVRCSFTNKWITIRVPSYFSKQQLIQQIESCKVWAIQQLKKKPKLIQKYLQSQFSDQYVIQTFDNQFSFKLEKTNKEDLEIRLVDTTFYCHIPNQYDHSIVQKKYIAKLLSRRYRSFFEEKLNYWNQFFPRRYQNFRIKYNSSNWGSCSSKGNINLSIRLVLCPESVIDYVVVHELAHLIHQNHSNHFWNEVERVFPNYKTQEKWLKTEGANLDF